MLPDKEIQNARPYLKPVNGKDGKTTLNHVDGLYRIADGDGLHLDVSPAGGKLWRLRYRFSGKEKILALGRYPDVRGPEARKRAGEARQAV